MIEKVNPSHPDKIADRIAGAIVDYAYTIEDNPCIAVEVLIGHGDCNIIAESTIPIDEEIVENIVKRIAGGGILIKCLFSKENLSVFLSVSRRVPYCFFLMKYMAIWGVFFL